MNIEAKAIKIYFITYPVELSDLRCILISSLVVCLKDSASKAQVLAW